MKQCFFCSQDTRYIDYKDIALIGRFVSSQAKIIDPRHTNTCAKHQRMLSAAIKRARFLGLLPIAGK